MKKILVLTPRFPFPVIGGDRLRIYKICQELSKHYELTLLSLCETRKELTMEVDDKVFKNIYRVYLSRLQSKLNVISAIPTRKPLQIAYYSSWKFKSKVNELMPYHDAVFSHLIRTGDYVKNINIKSILEMTDAISLNYKRVAESNSEFSLRKLVYIFERKRLEKYERNIVNSFDMVSLISGIDKDYLYPQGHHKVKVYGNGVDTKNLIYKKRTVNNTEFISIIFIGNMYSLQNMDAVKWFCHEILPNLCDATYKFKLKVVGKIKDSDRDYLNPIPNVEVTGTVDDINEACSDGHLAICPIRLGAGIQNKILEYMALGLPCITSSVGFEGIGATDGREILIANNLEEYQRKIHELINNKELFDKVSSNARTFVETHFSWEARLNPLINDLDFLIGNSI